MRRLRDRVAVVTGAASGIGRATSVLLAGKGCAVALADVNAEGLAETARLVEAAGGRASTHLADVADRKRMEALPAEVISAHGCVHLLVNNAGVSGTAHVSDHDLDDFAWIVGVNFWGVVHGCRYFLPHLQRAEEGHIVNLSSMLGLVGLPSQSAYCATKFAVRGFTESLRAELHGSRVGVTCVLPGGVKTSLLKSARMADEAERRRLIALFEKTALPPEAVAARIVSAVLWNKARILIGLEAHAVDYLTRLFPVLAGDLVGAISKRTRERRS
jgi:NADP-dependent 3-hydroxy acid dehydrogenase YdfG